jgi:hypothetical protein
VTDQRQKLGIAVAVALAVAALAAVLFVPGIGCGGADVSNIHKQANKRSLSRHKFDSLSQFLDAQRKINRRRKAKEAADQNPTVAKSPRELTTFRTSLAEGVWQRIIWSPSQRAADRTLTPGKQQLAQEAAVYLNRRLELVTKAAGQARIKSVADAAENARHNIGALTATLSGKQFDPRILDTQNRLMDALLAAAKKAGLRVVPTVPQQL